jgi:hypothetical protein
VTNVPATGDEQIIAQIEAAFPGWHVWRPKRGDGTPSSWVATLRDVLAGLDETVVTDSAGQLRVALADQRDRVERTGVRPLEVFPPADPDDDERTA